MTKPQRGNALFLILIAVALFAALSYAITQSSRGGGAGTKKETDAILAAQIVQSGAVLKAAAMRMVFSGTPAADIKLHLPASSTDPCTVTDGTCLFTDGGATWPSFPDNAYNQALITMLNMPSLGLGKPHASEAGDNCSGRRVNAVRQWPASAPTCRKWASAFPRWPRTYALRSTKGSAFLPFPWRMRPLS